MILEDLVDEPPVATRGVPTGFSYGTGEWRHVLEIADPAAGSAVAWYDITAFFTGYDYTRGADSYQGRYRASVVTIDLFADDDRLAPWNSDTTLVFGINIELGPGLLIRSGFIRVDGGVVVEWNPRFTDKVESWGDASYSKGRVRQHTIVARDTLTSLVAVPLPARPEENWATRIVHFIADSGWPYGQLVYGAQTTSGGAPIKLLPARPASASAISELDATLDPAGLIWYTNRKGQLVIRPPVWDSFHATAFAAGAAGIEWVTPFAVAFHWGACAGEEGAAYAVDTDAINPFGLDKSELAVINHVVITTPASGSIAANTYNDDDPISIQRYDRKTMQATWIAANDVAAADLLAFRANAVLQARPLTTTVDLDGFHPGPASIDVYEPLTIVHQNRDGGLEVSTGGYLRGYRERVLPRGCDTDWSLEITADVTSSTATGYTMAPVEDLTLVSVTDTTAAFSWTNPPQVIEPTHTQIRMLDETSDWDTVSYPITGAAWSHLDPETDYQFEVRLIREVDGVITDFSPIRSLTFTTLEPVKPHVDKDPDDDDQVIVKLPPPGPGCTLEWQLETSDGVSAWTVIDSGTLTDPDTELTYPITGLDPDMWYRFCSREVCAGVPGAWTCSDPFLVACVVTARLGTAPYNDPDLWAYWPQICAVDEIEEAISGTPLTLGNAFASVGFVGSPSVPAMLSHGAGVIGSSIPPAPPAGTNDLTIACRVNIGALPGTEQRLFQYGAMTISIRDSGSGFHVAGVVRHSGGSVTTIVGTTVLALYADHDLVFVHDVGVGLKLYANGVEEGTAALAIGDRDASSPSIQLTATSWITDCAVWDRVLAITEIPGHVPAAPWTPADLTGVKVWYDASNTGSITASAGAVSQVNDLSGNGYHAVQSFSSNKPTTGAATQNGLNVIRHDGGDWMHMTTVKSNWQFLHDGTKVLFAAVWNPGAAGTRFLFSDQTTGVASRGIACWATLTSNRFNLVIATGLPSTVSDVAGTTTNSMVTFAAANLWSVVLDPANATPANRILAAYNGGSSVLPVPNTGSATPASGDPAFRLVLGANPTSDTTANSYIANTGWWAELVIVAGAEATEANRVLLRDYMNAKWGVY